MRTIFDIAHPEYKITVYVWNEKYLIELEAGPLKQVYKIPVDKINGEDELKLLIDDVFLRGASQTFERMFATIKGSLERHLDN